jgi:gamma-glutamyltranspeptidase/glutathione hydrolase
MFTSHRSEFSGFRSQRSMVLARRGMVCTSQPLASMAGLETLRQGGTAVDAAVSAAAVLGVVEPFMTGIGGDCFMLIWHAADQTLYGLNGSGRAPAALSLATLQARGLAAMPAQGLLPVTVPGAVDAWEQALHRFGRLPLGTVLAPAIHYAREGYPVSEIIASQWNLLVRFGFLSDPAARQAFTLDGDAPRLGEHFSIPDLATTLEEIAAGGADAFYRGPIAERIVRWSRQHEGLHSLEDFAGHTSSWVDPVSSEYRGYRLYELPPNGQGLAALLALNILENFTLDAHPIDSAEAIHLRIEAVKLAFADRGRYIADPDFASVPVAALLSKDYAHGRAALIRPDRALKHVTPGRADGGGDTVYLTAADTAGNVVSLINSLYFPFGSGMVVPGTGIILQNRGYGFVVDPAHPNCLAPGKRPFHTIIPAMLFRDGAPLVSFGVMGGDIQPQGHLQVVSNLVDYGLNIQEALDYPRFRYLDADRVAVEDAFGGGVIACLEEMGHATVDERTALALGGFGGGQGIMIDPMVAGYWGGSDHRKDGCAVGF